MKTFLEKCFADKFCVSVMTWQTRIPLFSKHATLSTKIHVQNIISLYNNCFYSDTQEEKVKLQKSTTVHFLDI